MQIRPVGLADSRFELETRSGAWLLDPEAGVLRGALGVPLDDVTGYVVAASAPAGTWPVSLGMRLDFLDDPPTDGSMMTARGTLVAVDTSSGIGRGEIADSTGRIIAVVTQRSHLVGTPPPSAVPAVSRPASHEPLRALLRLRADGRGLKMPPTPLATNGMGNVHGGILIGASECAAMSTVDARGRCRTLSVDISYLRPCDGSRDVTFRAEVVRQGRTLVVVRVVSANVAGKPCSIATFVIRR